MSSDHEHYEYQRSPGCCGTLVGMIMELLIIYSIVYLLFQDEGFLKGFLEWTSPVRDFIVRFL